MSTKIRMARGGSKKRPFYRIVVADARSPRDGRFIERIGSYNPMLEKGDEKRVVLDIDRAKHWLGEGAQPSDRVARFLGEAGLMAKYDVRETPKKSAPKAKAQERMREAEEAAAAAKEAEAAAKAEAEAAVSASDGEVPATEIAAEVEVDTEAK